MSGQAEGQAGRDVVTPMASASAMGSSELGCTFGRAYLCTPSTGFGLPQTAWPREAGLTCGGHLLHKNSAERCPLLTTPAVGGMCPLVLKHLCASPLHPHVLREQSPLLRHILPNRKDCVLQQ